MSSLGGAGVRRNDVTALLLIAVVSLAPIPLGSNRPGLWAITDALVFAVFLAQSGMRMRDIDERSRFLPRTLSILWLFAAVVLWHAVQLLPLGAIFAGSQTGIAIVGKTISLAPGQTTLMLLNFLTYGAVFILAFQIGQRPGRAMRLYAWTGFMVGVFALFALYNFVNADNTLLGLPREFYVGDAAGTFVNRNSFATFLGLGLVVNVGLAGDALFRSSAKGERPQLAAALVHATVASMLIAGLLATHSRMGLFASLVGAVTAFFLTLMTSGGVARLRASAIGLVLLGVASVAALYGQGVLERLGSSQSDLDVRLNLYEQAWELIWARPLLGFGAGTFEAAFPLVHHLPVNPDVIWDKAHNTYLTLFVELGLIVGIIPILIVGLVNARFVSALRTGSLARLGAAIGLGATVQVGLHSLVDFSLEIHAVALLFSFLLGLGVATTEMGKR